MGSNQRKIVRDKMPGLLIQNVLKVKVPIDLAPSEADRVVGSPPDKLSSFQY